jgi:hypothetical protein
VRSDRRRIQTAVLGGADSEEPLMLPLEAIEPDAFRQRHEHDAFWCGLLLGGCGLQLISKLYTDRVCHFAHYARALADPEVLLWDEATSLRLRTRRVHRGHRGVAGVEGEMEVLAPGVAVRPADRYLRSAITTP